MINNHPCDKDNFEIGTKSKYHGKVIAIGIREGEPYRFLIKNGVISLMPLSVLQEIGR